MCTLNESGLIYIVYSDICLLSHSTNIKTLLTMQRRHNIFLWQSFGDNKVIKTRILIHLYVKIRITSNTFSWLVQLTSYTSVADYRRQSPTVLSLEQATTGVVASCRSNALELSESINSRSTERQNDSSTEFKFKCKFEFEFKFLFWVVFTPRNNICAFWMATHIVSV